MKNVIGMFSSYNYCKLLQNGITINMINDTLNDIPARCHGVVHDLGLYVTLICHGQARIQRGGQGRTPTRFCVNFF